MLKQKCENYGHIISPTYFNLCWQIAFSEPWLQNDSMVTTSRISRWIFLVTTCLVIKNRDFHKFLWNDMSACCGHDFADNNLPYSSFEPWYPKIFRVTSKLTRCYLFDIQLLEKWKRMIFVTPRRSFLWLLLDGINFPGQAANFCLKQAVYIPKALHGRVHLRYLAPF